MFTQIPERLSSSLPHEQSAVVAMPDAVIAELAEHYRDAAVLITIIEGEEPALLLTKRAEHLSLHPGEIAFPGGKPDTVDDNLIATAIREAQEEVNLLAKNFNYVGQLSKRITRSGFLLTPCVGYINDLKGLHPNEDEVAELFSIPLSLLADNNAWQFDWLDYRGTERFMPRFEFKAHILEGVTALLVIDLMNVVFEANLPSYD